MKRGVLLLSFVGVVAATVAAAAFVGAAGPTGAKASSHREAPADRRRPGGGQHGPVRVREPRPAGHRDDHRQLRPVRGAGRRPELLPVRSDDVRYEIHVDNDGDARDGRHVPVPVQDARREPEHVPLQHGPDPFDRRPGPQRQADLHGHAHRRDGMRTELDRDQALPVPPANIGPRSNPNYRASPPRRQRHRRRPAQCSPARATTRSSSTSGRSSTSAGCARSTRRI